MPDSCTPPAKRLLIVDDEPGIARLIERVATGLGFEVTVTHEAEAFTECLISTDPDVIVLDLSLPGVDGVELIRFLGTSRCRARIIVISGFDGRVLETTARLGRGLGLRISNALSKPLRAAEIRTALNGPGESLAA